MFETLLLAESDTEITALTELLGILFWVARCLLILIGGGGGLFMIVKGKTEENPRDTQEGFFALGGAGVLFAATFAIEAIFK